MRYEVEILFGSGFDIWLHSYFLTGLIDLARDGEIKLRNMKKEDQQYWNSLQQPGFPLFVLKIKRTDCNASRVICFDPMDKSSVFQISCMAQVHHYYKRNFFRPYVEELPEDLREKVKPINPIFAVWSGRLPL
ncbi:MAG TPA: hypothetical protein PLK94_07625 [Alphaproteobacteria bacterium]|nr:hypothetical protein [Alphaproteobacteria bacterium]